MKERPILFSAPMVRALRAGTKTQTRRMVKPQPNSDRVTFGCIGGQGFGFIFGDSNTVVNCPYGQPGDRLWVRETWRSLCWTDAVVHDKIAPRPLYGVPDFFADTKYPGYKSPWSPSIHMRRELCRIKLEITSVRVERVQETTLGDICAEGLAGSIYDFKPATAGLKAWRRLWASTYGESSWDANPWVWVVEFKRVEVAA